MEAQSIKRILKVLIGVISVIAPLEVFAQIASQATQNALNLPGLLSTSVKE